MEIKDNIKDQRLVVKQILESQFNTDDSLRAIDIFYQNIKTQDGRFFKQLKERLRKIVWDIVKEEGGSNLHYNDLISEEIDKLSGYAFSEDKENHSHSSEDLCAGVEKEIKPVETPREKELSRKGNHEPILTSPCDTKSEGEEKC